MKNKKDYKFIFNIEILNLLLDSKNRINSNIIKNINNEKYKELKKFLDNRYNDIPSDKFSYSEIVYRIKNNIDIRPVCEVCGKPVNFIKMNKGFSKCCSKECSNISPKRIEKIKETCIKKYGNTCVFNSPYYIEKIKETNIEKYGVDNPWKSHEIIEQIMINRKEKTGYRHQLQNPIIKKQVEETNYRKYGTNRFSKTEKFKELYKDEEFLNHFKKSQFETYKKNKSFNKSKEEEYLKDLILSLFDDCIYQYKDEKYNHITDFFIPSLNLYIEYHGSFFHHGKIFNQKDPNDLKELDKIIQKSKSHKTPNNNRYNGVIVTWSLEDPQKLQDAINSKINYLVLFPKWHKNWKKIVSSKYIIDEELNDVKNTLKEIIENYKNSENKQLIIGEISYGN